MPNNAETLIRRIEMKLSTGDVATAIKLLRELTDTCELGARECLWAITTLSPYGDAERVEKMIARLTALEPNLEPVKLLYADFLRESGRFGECETVYRQVLQYNPKSGRALHSLATIQALRTQDVPSSGLDSLPAEDQALIKFAEGKLAEDAGRFEEAMGCFDRANEVGANHVPANWQRFSKPRIEAEDERLKGHFSKSFMAKWKASGLASDRSIFIVGMPRSGTTLLERVLAGHPELYAAGELSFWTMRVRDLMGAMQSRPTSALPLAEQYEQLLETIAPGANRVINKNPMNAKLVGALHILMPNARFVCCSRHPVDHCLSMWKTFGGAPKDMAFSKRLLVDGYTLNRSLCGHWARALPSDRFLQISYEQLVVDTEATARNVVHFCGLEWSDACLSDRNGGSVRTPSAWQVRQPIYTSSLEVWRHYEPWLGEFGELLSIR